MWHEFHHPLVMASRHIIWQDDIILDVEYLMWGICPSYRMDFCDRNLWGHPHIGRQKCIADDNTHHKYQCSMVSRYWNFELVFWNSILSIWELMSSLSSHLISTKSQQLSSLLSLIVIFTDSLLISLLTMSVMLSYVKFTGFLMDWILVYVWHSFEVCPWVSHSSLLFIPLRRDLQWLVGWKNRKQLWHFCSWTFIPG